MSLNQLFCKRPDDHILKILVNCFKLENIEDNTIFTKKDLQEYGTVEKINENKIEFENIIYHVKEKNIYMNLMKKKQ